jgi:hypothetical protein
MRENQTNSLFATVSCEKVSMLDCSAHFVGFIPKEPFHPLSSRLKNVSYLPGEKFDAFPVCPVSTSRRNALTFGSL